MHCHLRKKIFSISSAIPEKGYSQGGSDVPSHRWWLWPARPFLLQAEAIEIGRVHSGQPTWEDRFFLHLLGSFSFPTKIYVYMKYTQNNPFEGEKNVIGLKTRNRKRERSPLLTTTKELTGHSHTYLINKHWEEGIPFKTKALISLSDRRFWNAVGFRVLL